MMLFSLKKSTQQLHSKLEQVSFGREIMTKQLSSAQYAALIRKSYVIYQAIEPPLNAALEKNVPLNQFVSSRLLDLEEDLRLLNFSDGAEDTATIPFHLAADNLTSWLGVLYVLEGARLGGNVILKSLKANAQLQHIPTFHFYQQKKINIGKRWKMFREIIPNYVKNDEALAETIAAANATFEYFYEVYKVN